MAVVKKDVGIAFASRKIDSGAPDRVVTVLAVSPYPDDHVLLRNIFTHSNWSLSSATSWSQACALLARDPAAVLICEQQLPDADWKVVLSEIENLAEAPMLVVTSRAADDQLWGEVLNLGAYDLLMKPFDHLEVVRVVSLAWLNWKDNRARRSPSLLAAGA